MGVLELVAKQALFDDPWTNLVWSLGIVAVTWVASWFLWSVLVFRWPLVPRFLPEDADLAYLAGHMLAIGTALGVSYWGFELHKYFVRGPFLAAGAIPVLWHLFRVLMVGVARGRDGEPPRPSAATAGS